LNDANNNFGRLINKIFYAFSRSTFLLHCNLYFGSQSLPSTFHRGLLYPRDVRILKFLSPRQSADFDQGYAVSPLPQQERNIGSASALNKLASSH